MLCQQINCTNETNSGYCRECNPHTNRIFAQCYFCHVVLSVKLFRPYHPHKDTCLNRIWIMNFIRRWAINKIQFRHIQKQYSLKFTPYIAKSINQYTK